MRVFDKNDAKQVGQGCASRGGSSFCMNRISVNGSSFVGKPSGYHPDNRWEACVRAVNDWYRPPETFAVRFEQMLRDVRTMGFDALDIWTAGQLNWRWATQQQIALARDLLTKHRITVTSLGDNFGKTRDEFMAACKMAAGVNTRLLSGTCPVLRTERAFVVDKLDEYDLYLGLENHPEKSAQEMFDQIGDGAHGRIGTTVDTGWYASQAHEVVGMIEQLGKHILNIHLKDVIPTAGQDGQTEDRNVGYGQGIVPLKECVRALKRIGYAGDYSVEIHSVDHDPTIELVEGLRLVRKWITQP